VSINEHLTKSNSKLFYEARQLKKQGLVEKTFTRNGTIIVKKKDTNGVMKKIKISCMSDISKLQE
jgi:CTP-dependent riboflavin kinase